MDGTWIYCAGVGIVFIALFGFIAMVQRASKRKEQLRSRLFIHAAALLVGIAGAALWLFRIMQIGFLAIPVVLLIGYGVFGLLRELQRARRSSSGELAASSTALEAQPIQGMSWKTKILGAAIVLLILACLNAGYTADISRDTGELALRADYPQTVRVGESFQLAMYLQNLAGRPLHVKDVDLDRALTGGESILAGATLLRTEPSMGTVAHLLGVQSYNYERDIGSGETAVVTFDFQAIAAGVFHTDIVADRGDATTTLWDVVINVVP